MDAAGFFSSVCCGKVVDISDTFPLASFITAIMLDTSGESCEVFRIRAC
jgi:hypothetical protein